MPHASLAHEHRRPTLLEDPTPSISPRTLAMYKPLTKIMSSGMACKTCTILRKAAHPR